MRKRRKLIYGGLMVLLMLTIFTLGAQAENLIINGDFEELNEGGLPLYWETDAYYRVDADTLFYLGNDTHSGRLAAVIESNDANDARFEQTVAVEPNSFYRLSGFIKTGYMPDVGSGANLSVLYVAYTVDGLFETGGGFQEFVTYGQTGEDQTEVTIAARLGGYGGESSGRAIFDDISLVKVDALPSDAVAKSWYQSEAVAYFSETAQESAVLVPEEAEPFTIWLILIALAFCGIMILFLPKMRAEEHDLLKIQSERGTIALFACGLLIAMAVRLVIGYIVRGYEVDIDCFLSWSGTMASHKAAGFYESTSFCDYVPGYLYVMWLNGLLFSSTNAQLNVLIIKLVPIICDVLGAMLLFGKGKKRMGDKPALAVALLYAFNPTAILNSAAWGQIDSVFTLLLLLVVILALEHDWHYAVPVFFLAVLVKPQSLMFGPLGLVALVMAVMSDRKNAVKALIGIGIGVLVAIIVVVPFNGGQPNSWLFDKYAETLSSYPHVTVNTANLYYILNGNWLALTALVPIGLSVGTGLLGIALSLYKLIKHGKGNAKIIVCMALVFLASGALIALAVLKGEMITYELFGYFAMGVVVFIALYQYARGKSVENLPLAGGILLLLLYVFGTRMHERYIFPAIILFAFAYILKRDWRILAILGTITATSFINIGVILDNALRLGKLMGHLNADNFALACGLATINILAAVMAVFVGHELMVRHKEPLKIKDFKWLKKEAAYQMPVNGAEEALLHPKGNRLNMRKKDYAIMLAITAVYSAVTLSNLGSTVAPQTTYATKSADDAIVFDLGRTTTFRMLYYAQVSYENFTVYVSDDNANWAESHTAQMAQGECFRWKYLTQSYEASGKLEFTATRLEPTGRYVKIFPGQANLKLSEVIFRDTEGNPIPAIALTESARLLLDEQDTLKGEPSWFNSTYFDEIYHARTAYEHAHAFDEAEMEAGTFPYETTHPPLGKVMMSWAVMLFGMTPFGWRFAGALMGILMLPAIYLMGKQLFSKTSYAAAATLLMALDCMHLTQTRIATIDSFPVLFIMLSYFFMLRYIKMDVWGKGLIKSMTPLFFSGLFMGLSIASKWIGIYAGMGLAVLFFYSQIQHLRQWRAAQKYGMADEPRRKAVARARYYGFTDVLSTCLCAILFFAVIPLVIYYVSYIPYFNTTGGVTIQKVIEAAIGKDYGNGVVSGGMLGYHATPNLGMDHPFFSPWHEWPLILKPMYYASDNYTPEGFAYSIFAMGNPAVWFGGALALIMVFVAFVKRHVYNGGLHIRARDTSHAYVFLLIGFLSQYLPWVLVPRGTYIYHYFASVPFTILCAVLCFKWLKEKGLKAMWVYVGICAVCFVILYPYASGTMVPTQWLDFAKNLMINRNIYY